MPKTFRASIASRRCTSGNSSSRKVSETDDDLLNKYLHGEALPEEGIRAALRRRTIASVRNEEAPFVPVLCGAAFKNKGVQPLIDAVIDYLPSPPDIPPMTGITPGTSEDDPNHLVERVADDTGAFRGAGLQGDDRPVRRAADLYSGLFRCHADGLVDRGIRPWPHRAYRASPQDAREQA